MATTHVSAGVQMIALQEIRTDRNVRLQLAAEEVEALAQSIGLLGQLTPVSVRPAEEGGYVLIAGHKRCAALASLGETQVRAEIRADDSQEESERAAENIVRSSLNPYEEALAVRAMLDRGLTLDGAAQALGWNRARVTARVKLLGERVLYGQRVDGIVRVTDRPQAPGGRAYLVERGLETKPELDGLVTDYLAQAEKLGAVPMSIAPLETYLDAMAS